MVGRGPHGRIVGRSIVQRSVCLSDSVDFAVVEAVAAGRSASIAAASCRLTFLEDFSKRDVIFSERLAHLVLRGEHDLAREDSVPL